MSIVSWRELWQLSRCAQAPNSAWSCLRCTADILTLNFEKRCATDSPSELIWKKHHFATASLICFSLWQISQPFNGFSFVPLSHMLWWYTESLAVNLLLCNCSIAFLFLPTPFSSFQINWMFVRHPVLDPSQFNKQIPWRAIKLMFTVVSFTRGIMTEEKI